MSRTTVTVCPVLAGTGQTRLKIWRPDRGGDQEERGMELPAPSVAPTTRSERLQPAGRRWRDGRLFGHTAGAERGLPSACAGGATTSCRSARRWRRSASDRRRSNPARTGQRNPVGPGCQHRSPLHEPAASSSRTERAGKQNRSLRTLPHVRASLAGTITASDCV